jgi:hypothetical protein
VVAQLVLCLTTDWATRVLSLTEENDFSSSLCVLTGSEAQPASEQWVPGVLSPEVKGGRGVALTTHPHLVPRSRMSRSYTSSPLYASMVCCRTALPLYCDKHEYILYICTFPFTKVLLRHNAAHSRPDIFQLAKWQCQNISTKCTFVFLETLRL